MNQSQALPDSIIGNNECFEAAVSAASRTPSMNAYWFLEEFSKGTITYAQVQSAIESMVDGLVEATIEDDRIYLWLFRNEAPDPLLMKRKGEYMREMRKEVLGGRPLDSIVLGQIMDMAVSA